MITCINLIINLPDNIKTTNISSVFHGALMELLPTEVQDQLHTMHTYNPLKQRLLIGKSNVSWEIVALLPDIGKQIEMIFENRKTIFLRYHQQEVDIQKKEVKNIPIKELMDYYLNTSEVRKYINLNIVTPTSFKSNGQYEIFPDIVKIFRSIMLMFDEFNTEQNMFDYDTLHFIENNIKIIDYRLRSTRFHIEGVKIPSFIGDIKLKVTGPPQLIRFVNLLLAFGSYSGIGIKTSIGMGKYLLK